MFKHGISALSFFCSATLAKCVGGLRTRTHAWWTDPNNGVRACCCCCWCCSVPCGGVVIAVARIPKCTFTVFSLWPRWDGCFGRKIQRTSAALQYVCSVLTFDSRETITLYYYHCNPLRLLVWYITDIKKEQRHDMIRLYDKLDE